MFRAAIAFMGLLYCEWPGPREAAEVMQCSRWVMPPIGKIGLFTFSILQMVGPFCFGDFTVLTFIIVACIVHPEPLVSFRLRLSGACTDTLSMAIQCRDSVVHYRLGYAGLGTVWLLLREPPGIILIRKLNPLFRVSYGWDV
jgi:hypothetical protein